MEVFDLDLRQAWVLSKRLTDADLVPALGKLHLEIFVKNSVTRIFNLGGLVNSPGLS